MKRPFAGGERWGNRGHREGEDGGRRLVVGGRAAVAGRTREIRLRSILPQKRSLRSRWTNNTQLVINKLNLVEFNEVINKFERPISTQIM